MGMFDTIYINDQLIDDWNEKFFKGDPLPKVKDWQTKDLNCCMYDYYIKKVAVDMNGGYRIKLYELDDPEDKRFFIEYTDEEVEESKDHWFPREKGGGYYTEEGFLPRNRRQRDMGETPHAIITVYCFEGGHGDVGYKWFDLQLKFTDGCLVAIRKLVKDQDSEWNNI